MSAVLIFVIAALTFGGVFTLGRASGALEARNAARAEIQSVRTQRDNAIAAAETALQGSRQWEAVAGKFEWSFYKMSGSLEELSTINKQNLHNLNTCIGKIGGGK